MVGASLEKVSHVVHQCKTRINELQFPGYGGLKIAEYCVFELVLNILHTNDVT